MMARISPLCPAATASGLMIANVRSIELLVLGKLTAVCSMLAEPAIAALKSCRDSCVQDGQQSRDIRKWECDNEGAVCFELGFKRRIGMRLARRDFPVS